MPILLPMSYSSIGTSSSHNNGMEGEILGLIIIECMCNLSIKIKIAIFILERQDYSEER